MSKENKILLPLLLLFLAATVIILAVPSLLEKWGVNKYVLLIGNFLFLLIGLLVFKLQKKALANENPNVFIRSIMSGMLIKMAGIIVALVVYWLFSGSDFNKATVIIAVILYLIYFITGVYCTMQLNKNKNA